MRVITEIAVTQEPIRIDSMGRHVGDPRWIDVDSHGHEHRFDGNELPTLEWVVTDTYWCGDCCDEHETGEWRCRKCAAVVKPHWNFTGPLTEYIPGLRDVKVFTRDTELPGLRATYFLRFDEADAVFAAGDRLAEAHKIVAARDPDATEYRDSAFAGP